MRFFTISLFFLLALLCGAGLTGCSNAAALLTQQPGIVSFTPTSGALDTPVAIAGLNFTGATAVTFNGVPAVSFSVVNSSLIDAVAPNSSTGAIAVTTPNGTGTSTSSFTY